MKQNMAQTCKHCETKKDKAAPKDKPIPAWQVVSTKTGKTLRHLKVDGKKIDYLGLKWCSLSAFAWVDNGAKVIPHFNEKAAKDTLKLYKLQTGDSDAQVIKIEVA